MRGAGAVVVAMTACALPELLERCRMAGMVDGITKPIDAAALLRCPATVLGEAR